jgi:hypothetical protein
LTKLVYIGGYGHSGSTLLEYLLASHEKVLACGEVVSAIRERGRKERCTCGQLAKDCPIWGTLQDTPNRLDGWTHEGLVLALIEAARDGGYDLMVDSSKTPWTQVMAPFRLRDDLDERFVLLHIVRDPRAVSWSAVKKAGRQGTRPLTALRSAGAALGWSLANIACEIFGRRYPAHYVRIRYEDLARDPTSVMQALLPRLLPGEIWRPEDIGTGTNRHQLYGNRLRARSLSLGEIAEDVAWKKDMAGGARALVGALTWPLRSRYGYR